MSHSQQSSTRLGEQIAHLIDALALVRGWSKKQTLVELEQLTGYAEATIYRWRQGRLRPPDDTLEILLRLGKEEANLDRGWGRSLLQAVDHPAAPYLVNAVWGPQEIRPIPNNIPLPGHTTFVGRQAEMARLLELLSPEHAAHLISVDGIGGVGKSALVLEAACRCLRASTGEMPARNVPTFEAIVFVSAKQQYLTPHGILHRHQAQRTLHDMAREISHTLDRPNITHATPKEQLVRVREALSRQYTLLIVDNLETVEDKQDILAFLYDLPPQVKAVITTRERALFAPIRLEHLPEPDGLQLIHHEVREKNVPLDDQQALTLYRHTGGIPAAIIYAIGRMAAGYSLEGLLARLAQHEGDVARFCFEGTVTALRGQPSHQLLMALALFPKRPLREAVVHVAGLNQDLIAAEEGLAKLQQVSFVGQTQGRFSLLSLTREYALAELAAHPNFELEARERWVEWYLNFTKEYGGRDWQEWHIQYDRLEEEWENLLSVFDWCAAEERYTDLTALWQEERVGGFVNIYGYWDDSLIWLNWLLLASERRGDWPVAVEAMADIAWRLTMMAQSEQLEEAEALLKRAWSLRDYPDVKVRFAITHNMAVLNIRQKKYTEAHYWLDLAEALVDKVFLEEREGVRRWISNPYWRAVAAYESKDYDRSETLFQQVMEHGRAIRWQRVVIYAQNWLADIAIVREKLDEAEHLLLTGLPVAERNRDKRRTAFYKRSFAYLEQKRGNLAEALRWAEAALDGFERLGMQPEIEETNKLVQLLNPGQA